MDVKEEIDSLNYFYEIKWNKELPDTLAQYKKNKIKISNLTGRKKKSAWSFYRTCFGAFNDTYLSFVLSYFF